MDRDNAPTEEEQYESYKFVLEKMEGKQVVIRTLDIGGDKTLPYLPLPDVKTTTKSGKRVEVCGNIGQPEDVLGVIANGGDGVGLFRTEFLYMDRDNAPTEEEQYESYKFVLEKMEGKQVVIRTLDIGGDKTLPYLPLPEEMNPFLGYRAIRLCLDRKEIFKVQLRAEGKESSDSIQWGIMVEIPAAAV